MSTLSHFPHPREAAEDGLLCVSRTFTTEMILDAYAHGIFPWPVGEMREMLWWSPWERAVFDLEDFHVPRRLRQTLRSERFRVTTDQAFARVIRSCASVGGRKWGTWITRDIIREYTRLHEMGIAHSVEVWEGEVLAGGLYGVAVGGLFAGESMFHRRRDASKVALVHTVEHLRRLGFVLFDVQMTNPHLEQFHVRKVSQEEYLAKLEKAVSLKRVWRVECGEWSYDGMGSES